MERGSSTLLRVDVGRLQAAPVRRYNGAPQMPEFFVPVRDEFPVDKEGFLRTVALFLADEGARSEVRLVASAPCTITLWNYDNWDGGQWSWRIDFSIPVRTFSQLPDTEREAISTRIKTAMNRVLHSQDAHSIGDVRLVVEIPRAEPNWREKAERWATGDGTTNQGRARSDNLAPLEHDGLLFRSRPEINLYLAFKNLGVAVAPLPVFIRGGKEYKRIEPDFVLIHAATVMVVEVDGDEFHHESPAQAHERLTMLSHEGVETERVSATDCDTPEKARICANRLLSILQHKASIR
jgi:hypothetical protein